MTIAWNVPGLPFTLSPSSEAVWTIAEAPATVTAWAAPHSDIFIDPGSGQPAQRRVDAQRDDAARRPPGR